MGIASAASAGLGIVSGISNMISGAKQSRDAKNALENYERQKLENIADGLQVSTLGSDLQREEQSRIASSQVNALRESGSRGLIGGLGRVQQGNQMVNRQIGADLDMQQKAIDQMRAEDEARIRSMQENREIADVSALSSQINTGEQVKANGISQGIQGVSMLGNAFAPKTADSAYGQSPYTTSGSPTGGTIDSFQSPIEQQNNPYYNMRSAGQPNPNINYNPFSFNQFSTRQGMNYNPNIV